MDRCRVRSRSRGAAAGGLTGALAVAAHGATGASVDLSGLLLVLAVAAATGSAASQRRSPAGLLFLLATGQALSHLALSVSPHPAHSGHALPEVTRLDGPFGAAMLVAHVGAVAGGAVLLTACDALARAVSSSARAAVKVVAPAAVVEFHRYTQAPDNVHRPPSFPFLSVVSRRGPPVLL